MDFVTDIYVGKEDSNSLLLKKSGSSKITEFTLTREVIRMKYKILILIKYNNQNRLKQGFLI